MFGAVRTDKPLRPQFHLMPAKNWMNDPDGPVYYNGYYHMFFIHNPNAPVWGHNHWVKHTKSFFLYHLFLLKGHCYSKDMVHWVRLPVALSPDQPYDSDGLSTGSTTIVNGIPVIMYSGRTNDTTDMQCQARPANISDPTLTNWTKSFFNPLISKPNGRDPSTAFQDDQNNYYLIYGYGTPDLGGQAVLFTSKDFINWTYLHPIHSNKYDKFWECPDIFNVSNRLVLKASLLGHDFWTIGNLDRDQLIFLPLNHDVGEYIQMIDHGRFYASKTFYDPINDQQVIMGWIPEEDNLGPKRGWQGCHSLPRAIFLSEDGLEIRSRPVNEVRTLRDHQSHRHFNNIILPRETPFELIREINGNQTEIQINWQFPVNQVK
jgi:beta-fructofuranosidase